MPAGYINNTNWFAPVGGDNALPDKHAHLLKPPIRYTSKGPPFDQIVSLMRQRRTQDSILIRNMIEIRDRYNGDIVIPLPDVQGSPVLEPPQARLIANALDNLARQAAGARPRIQVPNMNPGSTRSARRADTRRKALQASWHRNQLWDVKLYRSYRQLGGYGTNAFVVRNDDETQSAKIELRDPLTTYPELRAPDDIRNPKNCGFIFGRSVEWLANKYPESREYLANASGRQWDTLWDVVEWIDDDCIVIGVLGPRMPAYSPQDARPYGYTGFEMRRYENQAGMVPVAAPRRVTLDRIMGQLSTMVGTYDLLSRLTSLDIMASEKALFSDLVILSADPNQPAILASGTWKDGREGEPNIVQGARDVKFLTSTVGPVTGNTMDRVEANLRSGMGASSMYEGTNPNSLRTGRAIAEMSGFSIDPMVEEAQRIQCRALECVNEAVMAVEKGYYPNKKFVVFTGMYGDDEVVEYTPADDFETLDNAVQYPIPGADISQIVVALSQLVGSHQMSTHTAREMNPLINDASAEDTHIEVETLKSAFFQSLATQASQGAIPPTDIARIGLLLEEGKNIYEAAQQAHQEAQERQATQAPPPQPGQVSPPGSQPGLGAPGQGAEMAQPPGEPIPPPGQSLVNLQHLTRAISAQPTPPPPQALAGANQ